MDIVIRTFYYLNVKVNVGYVREKNCPVRAPGQLCSVIHVLISAVYKLFVCVFT